MPLSITPPFPFIEDAGDGIKPTAKYIFSFTFAFLLDFKFLYCSALFLCFINRLVNLHNQLLSSPYISVLGTSLLICGGNHL